MHTSVVYELTVFAGAGAAGILTAFLYDLFRLKRRIVKTASFIVHIEDILFWLSAAVIVFLTSYVISSGETRFYFFMGIFAGSILYSVLLSKIILWTLTELIKILLWPFREIIRFITPIFRLILLSIRKILGKIRNRFAISAYRVGVDMRRLKNVVTKK